ncbi:MAG: LacI family transcriptional regulator [Bacilli bacterium]|jgi:LacI family transcriptional regulator|nr:LacI family transcriptional regulator [Bacilli bacterium]
MTKIKDIAKACGVSVSTVSKALNGNSDLSEETAARVRKAAKELGYIPNSNARVLKTNRSHNIGVIFEDPTSSGLKHEYFSGILNSIKDEAESCGYDVTFISNHLASISNSYYEHARFRGCDGVIVASADFHSPKVVELIESEIPSVTIDYVFDNRSAIMSDNYAGLHDIVQYLYMNGHRKIAFIHGEMTAVCQKRLSSYYKTMEGFGLKVPDEYVKQAFFHLPKASGEATKELLALTDRPDCIIYPDDYSMLGGITALEEAGLEIPDDISIVGYDGIQLSRFMRPVFTTYVQDSEKIGKSAAHKLIETIESPRTSQVEQITIKGWLQEGKTVKALIR